MSGWGISENASEKEKLKAEVNDYFHGLNSTGTIDYICYCELYDTCMPILEKCYDRMEEERKADSASRIMTKEDMTNEVLNQEPTTTNDLAVDCISRADARKAILAHQYSDSFCAEHNIDHSINTRMALIALSDLPPITLQKPILSNISDKIETKHDCISYGNNDYDDGFVAALEWVRDVIDDCKKERNKI